MMGKSTSRNAATNHASQIKNHGSMNKAIRVGVIGLGTVGQGVLRLLKNNADEIARRVGRPLAVTHVSVRDASKSRDCDLFGITTLADAMQLARDADVDVIVEAIGDRKSTRLNSSH